MVDVVNFHIYIRQQACYASKKISCTMFKGHGTVNCCNMIARVSAQKRGIEIPLLSFILRFYFTILDNSASKFSPLRFLAIITPLPSIRKLVGIDCTP